MATKKMKLILWTTVPVVTGALIATPIALYYANVQDTNITEITLSLNEAISKTKKSVYESSFATKTIYEALNPNEDTLDNPLNGDTLHVDPINNNKISFEKFSALGLSEEDMKEFVTRDDYENIHPVLTLTKYNHSTTHNFVNSSTGQSEARRVSSASIKLTIYYSTSPILPTEQKELEALNKRVKEFEVTGFKEDITHDIMRSVGVLPRIIDDPTDLTKPEGEANTSTDYNTNYLDKFVTATLDTSDENNHALVPLKNATSIYKTLEGTMEADGKFQSGILKDLQFEQSSIKYLSPLYLNSIGAKVEYAFWKDVNPLHGKKFIYKFDVRVGYRNRYEHNTITIVSEETYNATTSANMTKIANALTDALNDVTLTDANDATKKYIESKNTFQAIGTNLNSGSFTWNQLGFDKMLGTSTGMGIGDIEGDTIDIIDEALNLTPPESGATQDEKDAYIKARGKYAISFNQVKSMAAVTAGGTYEIQIVITNGGLEAPYKFGPNGDAPSIMVRSSDYDNEPSVSSKLAKIRERLMNVVSTDEYENTIESLPREGTNVTQTSFLSKDLGNWNVYEGSTATVRYDILSRNAFTFKIYVKAEITLTETVNGSTRPVRSVYNFNVNYLKAQVVSQKEIFTQKYGIQNASYEYTEKTIMNIPSNGVESPSAQAISDQTYSTNGVTITATLSALRVNDTYKRKALFKFKRSVGNTDAVVELEFIINYPKAKLNDNINNFKTEYGLVTATSFEEANVSLADVKKIPGATLGNGEAERSRVFTVKPTDILPADISSKAVVRKIDELVNASATIELIYSIGTGLNTVTLSTTFEVVYIKDKASIIENKMKYVSDSFKREMGLDDEPNKEFVGSASADIDNLIRTNDLEDTGSSSLGMIRTTFGGDSSGKGIPSSIASISVTGGVTTHWTVTSSNEVPNANGQTLYKGREYTITLKIGYTSNDSSLTKPADIVFKVKSSDYFVKEIDFVESEVKKAIPYSSIANAYTSFKNRTDLENALNSAETKDSSNLHTLLGQQNLFIQNIIISNSLKDTVSISWDYDQNATIDNSTDSSVSQGAMFKIIITIKQDSMTSKTHSFYIKSSDFAVANSSTK